MAAKKKKAKVTPLKRVLNPKNRGNFVPLSPSDIKALSPREKDFLRTINELEKQLDEDEKETRKKS